MRTQTWINPITLILVALLGIIIGRHVGPRSLWAESTAIPDDKDNSELARLFHEDQSDRTTKDGKPIDWKAVEPRDKAR